MRYSVSTDAVYCAPCIFFGSRRADAKEKGFGMSSSVNDWANLGRCVSRHLQDGSKHHENVRAAEEFLRITDGKKFSILESMSESYNSRIKRNREILSCIIDVVNRTWHLGDMKRKIAILLLFFTSGLRKTKC